jgi:anti-anti-sigma factor
VAFTTPPYPKGPGPNRNAGSETVPDRTTGGEHGYSRNVETAPSHRELVKVTVAAGDPVVLTVAGRLFYDILDPVAEALAEFRDGGGHRLVLDLTEVPMCDSSGLNLMVRTRSDVTAAGGWLRLAGTQPMVRKVLDITNLTRLLPTYDTVAEALAAP